MPHDFGRALPVDSRACVSNDCRMQMSVNYPVRLRVGSRRTPIISIDATGTVFSVATPIRVGQCRPNRDRAADHVASVRFAFGPSRWVLFMRLYAPAPPPSITPISMCGDTITWLGSAMNCSLTPMVPSGEL